MGSRGRGSLHGSRSCPEAPVRDPCWGQLLSGCAGALVCAPVLVTVLLGVTLLLQPFFGASFRLDLPREEPYCGAGWTALALSGAAVTRVSGRPLWCVQSGRRPLGAGDSQAVPH